MLSIIVAIGKNNVIGKDNKIPWKISADMKYFSKVTTGKTVLMGKKTYLSIVEKLGKPLPNRKNVVLSRTEKEISDCEVINELNDFVEKNKNEEIFVIGGASIYEQTLPLSDKLYITEIDCNIDGDAFFPAFNKSDWNLVSEDKHSKDEKNKFDYNFKIYERKK